MAEPVDFARLDALLDQALEVPAAGRAEWIAQACAGDDALRARLLRLVALAEGEPEVLPPSGALRGPLWDDLVQDLGAEEPGPRPGDRLGRYELRGVLGTGAMGRVYRAFDPALAREVAIKALVRGDADAADEPRFEREARLLATLNHPNIAAVYGWERIDGAPYLVMELVEGPTLGERLAKGALPLAEVVSVSLQLAVALEEAHRHGIVHRDLKPSNVTLDLGGRVKVLDFGIAKAVAGDGVAPTAEAMQTEPGAVLGTAPYMSPEQVRAEAVDTRSDVWAFGCLVYEMLTGRRAFPGSSNAEVLAAILRDEPDWDALPASTPAGLRRVLRRCLRRDRGQRLQDVGDARIEIAELEAGEDAPAPSPRRRLAVPLALTAVVAALAAVAAPRLPMRPAPAPVVRLSLELPADVALARNFPAPFAISPDGSRLALLAVQGGVARLFVRRVDGLDAVPVAGSENATQPAFSPDGRWVAFFADRKLKKAPIAGGAAVVVADSGANPRGVSWGPDGTMVLAATQVAGLLRVAADGGEPRPLTQLDLAHGETSHRWPQVLPGGRWVLFTTGIDGAGYDDAHLDVVSLASGERRRLWSGGSQGRYAAGHLFFVQAGRLFAVPLDLDTLTVRGTPRVMVEGVSDDPRNGAGHFAVAEDGPLVYGPGPTRSIENYLSWVDAAGNLTRIGETPRRFRQPSLSPDGRRVAAVIGVGADSALWVIDTATATLTRAAAGGGWHHPIWTPDGKSITAAAEHDGRWRIVTLAPGTRPTATLLEGTNRVYPNAWSPDRRSLIFQERRPESGWDLRILDVGAEGRRAGEARDLVATPFQEAGASLSADGRFFAYESDELDNSYGSYLAPLANPAARRRAAAATLRSPRWGRGRDLYCWFPIGGRPAENPGPEGVHRIEWRAEGVPAGTVALWTDPQRSGPLLRRLTVAAYASYDVDVSDRGPRFLVLETSAPTTAAPLQRPVVVFNWLRELQAREAASQ